MLRKLALALAAILVLVAGSLATMTEASARRGGHGFHGGRFHGGGFHRGGFHRGFHGGGWHRGGFHRGWHRGWHRPRHFYGGPRRFYGGYGGCYIRRVVLTPWGPRYRLINRCY